MRALLAILFLSCLTCFGQLGVEQPFFLNPIKPSCDTLQNTNIASGSVVTSVGYTYFAAKFVVIGSYTCCRAELYIGQTGSPTADIQVGIYSDNGGVPGSLIGNFSDAIAASALPAFDYVSFENISATISNADTNWVVVKMSTAGDASNYVSCARGNGGTGVYRSTNGSTWSLVNATASLRYFLYSN